MSRRIRSSVRPVAASPLSPVNVGVLAGLTPASTPSSGRFPVSIRPVPRAPESPPAAQPTKTAGIVTALQGQLPPVMEVLDRDARLSESKMWQLLEEYYQNATLQTWFGKEGGTVPFYVTCNAVIGDAYAELICAHLTDIRADLDPQSPLYVVELASGSGMFSFNCARALRQRLDETAALRDLPVRYVMTDFTNGTVDGWNAVPSFEAMRASGFIDSAVFWPERDKKIALRSSGESVSSSKNPAIIIANYFFDSIRADAFRAAGGQIYEALYTLLKDQTPGDPRHPFRQIHTEVKYSVASTDYYECGRRNAILKRYAEECDGITFAVPTGALNVMDNLRGIFGAGYLLLSSDKGFASPESMRPFPKMDFAEHGSVSFNVNYDAIAQYARLAGGRTLLTEKDVASLHTLAALVPSVDHAPDEAMPAGEHLPKVFRHRLLRSDEINAVLSRQRTLRVSVATAREQDEDVRETLDEALTFIRGLCFDSWAFMNSLPLLLSVVANMPPPLREDVKRVLLRVEEGIFLGNPEGAMAFMALGRVYGAAGLPADALRALQRAEAAGADSDEVHYLLSATLEALGDLDGAIAMMEQITVASGQSLSNDDVERQTVIAARVRELRIMKNRCLAPQRAACGGT